MGPHRVGVISHLPNPTFAQVRALAQASEAAGADWLGLPDAFWWRDSYLLLADAARATQRIALGPLVTNAYLRHPFHTVAALASLQEIAGERVFVGIGAGGSEVSGAAGISRREAAARVHELVELVRRVAKGGPLDPASGRTLEIPLHPLKILIAGRGDAVLRTAGECADQVLLWAVPRSDLARSISVVASGALVHARRPELVWAPLVDHDAVTGERLRSIAAYSVLNSHAALHARWGLTSATLSQLRKQLVAGGAAAAQSLVPEQALEDLIFANPDPATIGAQAADLGATSVAVPAFTLDEVADRVGWARAVLQA